MEGDVNEHSRRGRSFSSFPLLVLCCLAIALSGCLPSTQVGPPRLYSVDEEIANVRGQSQLPDFVAYAGLSDEGKRGYRDALFTARMYAIDLEFSNYEIELTQERQSVAAGGDLAAATLSGIVPLVTGVNAKNWLGFASAMTTSGKAIYSNDILFAKTIQILQTQMEATRAHIAAIIKTRLGSPVSVYPLAAALSDLEDYYRAGTLTGAVNEVTSTVSGDAAQAKQEKADAVPANLRPFSSSSDRLPPIQPGRRLDANGEIILPSAFVSKGGVPLVVPSRKSS